MKKSRDISGIVIALLLSFVFVHAQTQVEKDWQTWQGISLEYKVNDKFTLALTDEVRLDQNISKFQLNLINLEAIYDIKKQFKIAGGYRFSLMPIVDRHRLYISPRLRHELKNINTKVYFNAQFQYELDKQQNNTAHLRPKLLLQYEPKFPDKIEPFLATELFYRLTPDSNTDQFRIYTGLDYKLTKQITLQVTYIHARDFNVETPLHRNIFFANFNIEID